MIMIAIRDGASQVKSARGLYESEQSAAVFDNSMQLHRLRLPHYEVKMLMRFSICWLFTRSLETASCTLEPFSRRNHTSRGLGEMDGS